MEIHQNFVSHGMNRFTRDAFQFRQNFWFDQLKCRMETTDQMDDLPGMLPFQFQPEGMKITLSFAQNLHLHFVVFLHHQVRFLIYMLHQ